MASRGFFFRARSPRDQNVFCRPPEWNMIGAVFEAKKEIAAKIVAGCG